MDRICLCNTRLIIENRKPDITHSLLKMQTDFVDLACSNSCKYSIRQVYIFGYTYKTVTKSVNVGLLVFFTIAQPNKNHVVNPKTV